MLCSLLYDFMTATIHGQTLGQLCSRRRMTIVNRIRQWLFDFQARTFLRELSSSCFIKCTLSPSDRDACVLAKMKAKVLVHGSKLVELIYHSHRSKRLLPRNPTQLRVGKTCHSILR
ncbi:hypothetical protein M404DRAFT_204332 [Pisolithus tinctorius Marx 270]|uniref:Uncharacterized protein n=1 Tax=Pisolithus tinctorius Marx 270 TaxID=870435 RepID=A0A0C3PLG6_PISTI|nr:hypothetical protein M404DRAFT_204332 [Pisolithus tinctorius Marx 270]